MAQLNGVNGAELMRMIRQIATDTQRTIIRGKHFADHLGTLDPSDLAELNIDAETQAWIGSFRVALLNLNARFNNEDPVNADSIVYFVRVFANPVPF